MIKGLKIENNIVFGKNEISESWEKLSSSAIQELEDLLKKADGISYSKEDFKENFVFENEVGIGQGSIKSSRDENGDFVFTIDGGNKEKNLLKINEDFDFGIEDTGMAQALKEERKLVNFWNTKNNSILLSSEQTKKKTSASPKKVVASKEAVINKHSILQEPIDNKTVENAQITEVEIPSKSVLKSNQPSLLNEITKLSVNNVNTSLNIDEIPTIKTPCNLNYGPEVNVPKLIEPAFEPLIYTFKKRSNLFSQNKKSKSLQVYFREIKELEANIDSISIHSTKCSRVSFIRKLSWNSKRRKHGQLLKAIEHSKKNMNLKDSISILFQLEKIEIKPLDDLEFESIISDAINMDVN